MGFPRQEYWSGGHHVLLQGIFLVQGLDLGLSHWQESSLPVSHQGIRRSFRLVVAMTKRQMNKYISDWIPVTCTRIAGSREGGPGHVSCGSKQWLSQPHWLCSLTVSLVKLLNLSVSQHLHLYNLFKKYLFIWLHWVLVSALGVFRRGMLRWAGSRSLARDWTWAPWYCLEPQPLHHQEGPSIFAFQMEMIPVVCADWINELMFVNIWSSSWHLLSALWVLAITV